MTPWKGSLIPASVLVACLWALSAHLPKHLEDADLSGRALPGQHWAGACLVNADLQGTDLRRSDLRGAKLRLACLSGATLQGANLAHADLTLANLCDADFRNANLDQVCLDHAMYSRGTRWPAGFRLEQYPTLWLHRSS